MKRLTRVIKYFICDFLYKVKYHNEEVLDQYPTYLICPNHSSVLDPVFVFPKKYDNDIYIVAKKELFNHASFRWLAKRYNVFAIDRDNVDVRSMLKSFTIFKENDKAKLIIFPEGKVVSDEEVGKVHKKGAAFIASHINKPIIPVYITRNPSIFHKVDVIYGKPYMINEEDNTGNKLENISKQLIEKIYSLNEENYK